MLAAVSELKSPTSSFVDLPRGCKHPFTVAGYGGDAMSIRKPFRALPLRIGPYHRAERRRAYLWSAGKVLAAAIAGGLVIGALSVPGVRQQLVAASAELGEARARPPQVGDYWAGCDDARVAGTAPIYAGEPDYREGMDGDADGIACESYRGR